MSLSRVGEEGDYFDVTPGYVYVNAAKSGQFNVGIQSVPHFCELAMRALAQSGELDTDELEACEQALRARFGYVFENTEVEE